jgi:hypothetical protein
MQVLSWISPIHWGSKILVTHLTGQTSAYCEQLGLHCTEVEQTKILEETGNVVGGMLGVSTFIWVYITCRYYVFKIKPPNS